MRIRAATAIAAVSLWVGFFSLPVYTTSCTSAPSSRVAQVQTLKAVGETAEAAVALSAQLYKDGHITPDQARQVMDMYDFRFQPIFRLAVSAAKADLSTAASPDLLDVAAQLSALVLSFKAH